MSRENDEARRVIEATRGQYLTYQGQVPKAFFSSTCEGHTPSAASVLGGRQIPPLGGAECGACTESK